MKAAATIVRSHTRAWMLYMGIAAIVVAAYLVFPLPMAAVAALDVAFPLANVIAIVLGIRWHRPPRLQPWVLFAIGMSCFLGQNAIRSFSIVFLDGTWATPLQDLFQSVGYVLIITALISLIYSRNGGAKDRASLIDASIIVVGAAMFAWVFVLAPFAHDSALPVTARLFKMLYPFANLILLAVSVRLAVSRGAQTPAFALLLLAMVASFVGNTLSLSAVEENGYLLPDNPINIAFFAAYLFAGAAPLHPTMRTLTEVGELNTRLTRTRIALFLTASVTGVAAYFIQRLRGQEVDVGVILVGSLVIFLLVLIRLAGLSNALRRSEQRFRSLVQNASDAFAILTPDGRFRFVSPASRAVTGYGPEELVGVSCFELLEQDHEQVGRDFFAEVLAAGGQLREALLRIRHKDGSSRWIEVACADRLDDPAVTGIVSNFHDVTEQKEAEEALRASERSSRLLFDSSPLPMWVFDNDTLEFLAVNDAAVSHYGYSRDEFLSMSIADIRPVEHVDRLVDEMERIRTGEGVLDSGEWSHRLKDGRLIDVAIISHGLEFAGRFASLVVAQDITERKRVEGEKENLELQLRQSQKLEAVGQLAGGIAHDFNNLLAVILNYGRFVRDEVPADGGAYEDMTQILNAADKASSLVKQLLAFSRREIVKPELVDLNDVVSDIHKLLIRTTKESIHLVVDLADGVWPTLADPGQLEQVLLNLAVNADAAMPNGGTLEIKTSNKVISEITAAQKADLKPGNYVCLSVSDDGTGMSEDVAAHIYEPFFTTKAIGEGTGLGLSTVYGIVKQAGGYIYAYSEEGRGTTFNIYLPVTDRSAEAAPAPALEPGAHMGAGSILVVEDEAGVRDITARILTNAGYDVRTAESPEAAIGIASQNDHIDLLLTDVIMPGLSGRELAGRLSSTRPNLRIIFMSGYTDEIIARQGVLDEGVTFLQKPFGAEDLLPMVARVLDSEASAPVRRGRTVLIVDDEQPMRHVLRLVLESNGFSIVGEADSAAEAVATARRHRPDLIVLDYSMPGANGSQAAPDLRDASPNSKICAFSGILDGPPPWADAFLSKERIGELPPVLDALSL